MAALQAGQADVLVLARDYQPGDGWGCLGCGFAELQPRCDEVCSRCHQGRQRQFDIKEEMVRLAERSGCEVEVVNHSAPLMRLGGAGCLLRYNAVGSYGCRAA